MKTLMKKRAKSVEETIAEMLTENTGVNMLDSGGDSGRSWQRNKGKTVKQFEKEPAVSFDHEFGYTISLYHYLTRSLELDVLCHEFNLQFVPAENWDGGKLEDVYGEVQRKDGTSISIDNRYDGVSLTTEDGKAVEIAEDDKVTLWLAE